MSAWDLISILLAMVAMTFCVFAVALTVAFWVGRRRSRRATASVDDGGVPDGVGPICPACGYELRATPRRCPECGAVVVIVQRFRQALANDWPPEMREAGEVATAADASVALLRIESPIEADLLGQQLTARGIRHRMKDVPVPGVDVFGGERVGFEVLVQAEDERAAREYLWRARGVGEEDLAAVLAGEAKVVTV
jgi:hypothetical protein